MSRTGTESPLQKFFDERKKQDETLSRNILHTQIRNAITEIEDGDYEEAVARLRDLIGE